MCQCTPSIRTPYCGKGDCTMPKPEGTREQAPPPSPATPTLAETLAVTDSLEEAQHVLARGDDATSDMIGRAIVILRHLASLQSRLAEVRFPQSATVPVPRGLVERAMESCQVNNDHYAWKELLRCLDPAGAPK